MIETLVDVRRDVCDKLAHAARNSRTPMHTPVVATANGDARVMVLRAFCPEDWTLRFHTDARAPKTAVLEQHASAGVVFFDREDRLQIRVRGLACIERDTAQADAAWNASDNYARRCYLGRPPGEIVDAPASGLPAAIEGRKPTDAQVAVVRGNFAILIMSMEEIDWYKLAHDGHRRALIRKDGTGNWLTP